MDAPQKRQKIHAVPDCRVNTRQRDRFDIMLHNKKFITRKIIINDKHHRFVATPREFVQ